MSSHVVYERSALGELLSRSFKRIEGKVKTLIDSVLADPTQRAAAKSLAEQLIWREYDTFGGILTGIEQPMIEVKAEPLVATAEGVEKA